MQLVTIGADGRIVRKFGAALLVEHFVLEPGEVMFSWEHWFDQNSVPAELVSPQFGIYGETRIFAEMKSNAAPFGRMSQLMVRIESRSASEMQEVIQGVIESFKKPGSSNLLRIGS